MFRNQVGRLPRRSPVLSLRLGPQHDLLNAAGKIGQARARERRCHAAAAPVSLPLQYDTDVTTWSPQGRIFQIEYAMEAVKQGSAAVGLKVGRRRGCRLRPAALVPSHVLLLL